MSQPRLKVRKGDQVRVITGKDRGKSGKVLAVRPTELRVVVEGLNIAKKHQKPRGTKPGGIMEVPQPMHVSNVMVVNPTTGRPCKVRRRREQVAGEKRVQVVRYSWQDGKQVDIDET
jgi:large subunit ribosomal protein L24